jgi:malonyl-CoA O-methyltransferase
VKLHWFGFLFFQVETRNDPRNQTKRTNKTNSASGNVPDRLIEERQSFKRKYRRLKCLLTTSKLSGFFFHNPMNIQQAYTCWSETYDQDRNLTRDLDEIVTRETLANLHCGSALELGCGTGKNTALLAGISQHVTAIDFSAGMIERARQKLSFDNVTFIVADISETWRLEGQSFDLVVCNLVLEHISDLSLVFAQASRVLRAEGRFFVSELHPFRQYQGTQANFQRNQQTTHIAAFVHHISDFIDAGEANKLALSAMKEWWHAEDQNKPPRLVSFMFQKR